MAVVVVTQEEWDQLWVDLRPPFRAFAEVNAIGLGEDVVVVGQGEPLSLEDLRKKLDAAGKLGGDKDY